MLTPAIFADSSERLRFDVDAAITPLCRIFFISLSFSFRFRLFFAFLSGTGSL